MTADPSSNLRAGISSLPPIIQSLLDPSAYPELTESVELGQTHISYLFFTPNFVYKVKKPVDFGFLDFSTLEKRAYYCQQELQLNRRISPDVYLDVVSIVDVNGKYVIDEGVSSPLTLRPGSARAEQPVEYAVKMRRLPADRMAKVLLESNQLTDDMVRDLGRLIADFHQRAETSPEISSYSSLEGVSRNITENFEQTEKYIGQSISEKQYGRIKEYALGFLKENSQLFQRRVDSGRIKDCHGDLHLDQICFTDEGVRVIDCIEFTERFRFCDVASDIAFLAMDLEHNGRWDLSIALMYEYLAASGDTELKDLLVFYKCYRAYVRGKVESFRLDDPHISEDEKRAAALRASHYFDLSYAYASRSYPPYLVITAGMVGTGKSAVAEELASETGMAVMASDMIRKALAGVPPTERHYDTYSGGMYSPEGSQKTYQKMFRLAKDLLKEGQSVILDATFKKREDREKALSLAIEAGARLWTVECVCPEEIVKKRLEQRERKGASPSDGRWEIYERDKKDYAPLTELPSERHIVVDTSKLGPRDAAINAAKGIGLI